MLKISARVENRQNDHQVTLKTNDQEHILTIPPKSGGFGSSANGGELLFLALATCYCNDIYREAAKRNITVHHVEVDVMGEFDGSPGGPADGIKYRAVVEADASEADILDLMRHTDTVAEIQNTLRRITGVTLEAVEAISLR
ncbi:MAG TPA: OsmC family protein [Aggregatilineaceae bacterium]|nr:OsmC family protein [Aggregatilineaceae bacterium]